MNTCTPANTCADPCPCPCTPDLGGPDVASSGGCATCGTAGPLALTFTEIPVADECQCCETGGADGGPPPGFGPDLAGPGRWLQSKLQPSVPGALDGPVHVNIANGNVSFKAGTPAGGAYAPPSRLTYNSLAADDAIHYGAGVAGLYNQTVTMISSSVALVIKGNGAAHRYTGLSGATGFYDAPGVACNSLEKTASGWTETQPGGLRFEYASTGQLSRIRNRGDQIWTLSYDGGGRLRRVGDPFSRLTSYVYDGADNLRRILDQAGRITSFTVDGSGDLTHVVSPELCQTEFRYDANHLLTAYIDPVPIPKNLSASID